jgi:hypothetical protein
VALSSTGVAAVLRNQHRRACGEETQPSNWCIRQQAVNSRWTKFEFCTFGSATIHRRFGIFRLGTNYSLSNVSCGDAEKVLRTEEQSGDKSPQSKKNAKLELRGRTRLELRGRRSLFCRLELSRNKLAASPYSFPKLTSTSCLIRGNRFEFTTQFCASSCLPNRRRPNAP